MARSIHSLLCTAFCLGAMVQAAEAEGWRAAGRATYNRGTTAEQTAPRTEDPGESPRMLSEHVDELFAGDAWWLLPRATGASLESWSREAGGASNDPRSIDLPHVPVPTNLKHRAGGRVPARMRVAQKAPAEEDVPVQATMEELFRPLQAVNVTGTSSMPPELAENADVATLDQPLDLAVAFQESSIPAFYRTSGYGVRKPPRNTWAFYCHPLYFEDPNLERCGQSHGCCTTICSAVQFVTRASLLPYLKTLDPPCTCVRTLPDCPTCHSFGCDVCCPRWSWTAAAVQGAAVTGLIYLIP